MRCYLMRNGHIFAVEELTNLSDAEVEQAMALYRTRGDQIDGVELWVRTRKIKRYPEEHAAVLNAR